MFFSLAVALDASMDYIHFQKPVDSGFWSIHTTDTWDAWHIAKKIKWACIVLAIVGKNGMTALWYLVRIAKKNKDLLEVLKLGGANMRGARIQFSARVISKGNSENNSGNGS